MSEARRKEYDSLALVLIAAVVAIILGVLLYSWRSREAALAIEDARRQFAAAQEADARRINEEKATQALPSRVEPGLEEEDEEVATPAPVAVADEHWLAVTLAGCGDDAREDWLASVNLKARDIEFISTTSPATFAKPCAFPADGSPLEIDVTPITSLLQGTPAIPIEVRHRSGPATTRTFDMQKMAIRREGKRFIHEVAFELDHMAVVIGKLVDDDAESDLSEAWAFAYAFDGVRPERDALTHVPADSEGRFGLLLPRDREWIIGAVVRTRQPLTMRVPRHSSTVYDLGTREFSRGLSVSGVVRRLGEPQPLAALRLALLDWQSADDERIHIAFDAAAFLDGRIVWRERWTRTDAEGRFSIDCLDAMPSEMSVSTIGGPHHDVHESLQTAARRVVTPPVKGIDLEIGGVELRTQVFGRDGPLQGWMMTVTDPSGRSFGAQPVDPSAARTFYVPAGMDLEIIVTHDSYEPYRATLRIPEGQRSADLPITMQEIEVSTLRVRIREPVPPNILTLGLCIDHPDPDPTLRVDTQAGPR